jgi:hypothetical protein
LATGTQIGYNFALARVSTKAIPRNLPFKPSAGVAQLVEQRIRNAKVEGSTPSTGTIRTSPPLQRERFTGSGAPKSLTTVVVLG